MSAESPMPTVADNPLLDFSDLPRFDLITPAHVRPAIESLIAAARSKVDDLAGPATPATWADFAAPLFAATEPLSRAWGVVGHLHSVKDVPEWREAYNDLLPEITRFYSELGQNIALFDKYQALASSADFSRLTATRQRIVSNEIRDFRLSGAALAEELKPRFQAIQEEMAALAAKFSENVLDATNAFVATVTDPAELAGLPADAIAAARERAEASNQPGWQFTLHMPSYLPVMQYVDHAPLRQKLYRAHATRAAEFTDGSSKPEWDNLPLIGRILALRQEEATLLGYPDFAAVSLVPKMADTPAQVADFLRQLATRARPFAERDLAELRDFADRELSLTTLEPWDIGWASEKLKQARYAFSDDTVKQYFPEPKVLAGLFAVIERLFAVRVLPDTAPVWHEDVRFFRIETAAGGLVGQFYLDLYARETKRGGAWMDEARTRQRTARGIDTPVAYLTCNFSRPVGETEGKKRPACFTHDEVITLFHETGHGLHHLLTRVEDSPVSGIHGVEWDAVELPSQFLENFCWEWDVLCDMTGHVDSGEPLPRGLFEKMLAAKNFQSGLQILRQIEFSLFDLMIHQASFDSARANGVYDVLAAVREEVAVLIPPAWHRFPNSFSHIFAGGYAAGYFSYKWAEVLSADAYSAFEDAAKTSGSALDPVTGQRFLAEILAVGGSRPAMESFTAFRGRPPEVDALLRHNGMIAA
jgi:oligopeptidase A